MIGYGINNSSIPIGIQPSFETWLSRNYQLVVRGAAATNLRDYRGYKSAHRKSVNAWVTYVDSCCLYAYEIYPFVLGTAATQGWADPEGVLLHMNVDYPSVSTAGGGSLYSGGDQFDYYEQSGAVGTLGKPTLAVNGAFLYNGSSYTDVSVRLYCPTPVQLDGACGSYTPNHVTVTDRLLLGYQTPFDTVNVTLDAPRSGGSVAWQYWNGTSFSSLTIATDTTNGLTTTGTVTFLPPSNWVPSVVHRSRSKYWIQVTVSGTSKHPKLAKVYGDSLTTLHGSNACNTSGSSFICQRGWNPSACVSGHINQGTPVEYCQVPAPTATAKFRQQARQMGYANYGYNDFYGNPINIQNGLTDNQNSWAYVLQARTATNLADSGLNGVMFDDAGCAPQAPNWASKQTELGSTDYISASTTAFTAEHMLLTAQYGAKPKWWDGLNSCYVSSGWKKLFTSMNWMLSELHSGVHNGAYMDTFSTEYLCTDSLWCPGQSTSNNPKGTIQLMQIQDFTQFGILDATCGGTNQPPCTVSNYHLWDMSQRGPMNTLAMFYMVKNPNLLFGYNPAGAIYNGYDDYYYWVKSAQTLAAPIYASTCTSGCSIPLSGQLETKTCPGVETEGCPIRIGGVDVVGTTSYSGRTLTTQTQNAYDAIINDYSPGASIEYAVISHQSQDSPLHTPIFMYGAFVPASAIYLGTPDSTYGFNTPCTSSSYYIDGGCFWKSGKQISGNPGACQEYQAGSPPGNPSCSPLLRRDFSGGTYGNAIVLLRPLIATNGNLQPTASTEYDTYSQTITLPGTYYQVMADGTISSTPITTTKLRGGEAGIYVTQP
jgi:hypothetical protein